MEASTFKSAYENARSEASQYLEPREWASRLILSLRFLALTLALLLSFFDRSQLGVMIPIMHMALIAIAYNVILVLLARHVRWLRQTLNVLVLDTLFTTAAVYLTGGYHSGFFILYFFIIIRAAFYHNRRFHPRIDLCGCLLFEPGGDLDCKRRFHPGRQGSAAIAGGLTVCFAGGAVTS